MTLGPKAPAQLFAIGALSPNCMSAVEGRESSFFTKRKLPLLSPSPSATLRKAFCDDDTGGDGNALFVNALSRRFGVPLGEPVDKFVHCHLYRGAGEDAGEAGLIPHGSTDASLQSSLKRELYRPIRIIERHVKRRLGESKRRCERKKVGLC